MATSQTHRSFLDSDDDDLLISILEQIDGPPKKPEIITVQQLNKQIPVRKKRLLIHADILEHGFVYFTHATETEPIYKANSGTQTFINSKPFWKIPYQNYRRVLNALKSPSNIFEATIDTPPDIIFTAMFTFRPKQTSATILSSLPQKLQSALYPHQRESVLFAASHSFRVFLADDMGLGKTIEAVAIACAAGFPKTRVVVVAPNHLVNTWVDAFLKWTNIFQSNINVLLRSEKITSTPLVIASYNVAVRKSDEICALDYDIVIADECHEFKNSKTQIYQRVSPIINKAKYLVLLSGTPMNRPSELFPQLQLLLPRVFSSFKDFGMRYCRGETNAHGYFEATGCTHSDELKTVLEQLVLLRREKDEVLTDLPTKKRFHVMLDYVPSQEMKEQIEQMRVHRIALATGMDTMKIEQSMMMTTTFSLTAVDKLPSVLNWFCGSEFRRAFFVEQRKCLVFAYHRSVIDGVTSWMTEQGVKCISINGSTPRDQRDCLFREFKTDPECKVAVLSIEIAATGITLTEASLVVFAELKWTPSDHQQAEDRVHRIGQKSDVEIYYLHAEGSLDDRIWEILGNKLIVISSVITSKTKTFETDTNA
ncbi:putative SMARCAL1-like protein [Tritrichomonas foetus]|uniref:SMARCAL1-like protein n=1 Tax=Tritrichomonas foetus TaxID=1144522 RepID=A0A1J4JMG6_9EUKA|nr:putative SMARCAL1-like protein [Tritrichomonas foetus]|eukprot:OHT00303.1 putative SMARCAL1-like protein [Tritrichomonas foetus]